MTPINDTIHMRRSKVLEKLRAGRPACSVKINISGIRATEIAAISGFDCIWTDMEHVPNDFAIIEGQIVASKLYDTDIIVRVPRGSYSDYIRPLEADASGIMVPHIMSLEDARAVVRYTRFHPVGLRPIDGGNADGKYCLMDFNEYVSASNNEKMVILQIEDPQPLKDLEAICDLQGYDILFFGPGDFSQAIGYPGQVLHPEVLRVRKLIAQTARRYHKFVGTVGVGNLQDLLDEGYQFINIADDVRGLGTVYGNAIRGFEALCEKAGVKR